VVLYRRYEPKLLKNVRFLSVRVVVVVSLLSRRRMKVVRRNDVGVRYKNGGK